MNSDDIAEMNCENDMNANQQNFVAKVSECTK